MEDKKYIKFTLDGCDINFIAKAPKDMTLEQFIKQASRIKPDWCACGIATYECDRGLSPEIIFDYNNVKKVGKKNDYGEEDYYPSCSIKDENEVNLIYCD